MGPRNERRWPPASSLAVDPAAKAPQTPMERFILSLTILVSYHLLSTRVLCITALTTETTVLQYILFRSLAVAVDCDVQDLTLNAGFITFQSFGNRTHNTIGFSSQPAPKTSSLLVLPTGSHNYNFLILLVKWTSLVFKV